ncbi:MAG: hypothetical protein ACJAUC_003642, partial [Planctomycetota bacterium]
GAGRRHGDVTKQHQLLARQLTPETSPQRAANTQGISLQPMLLPMDGYRIAAQ